MTGFAEREREREGEREKPETARAREPGVGRGFIDKTMYDTQRICGTCVEDSTGPVLMSN